ncbi:hypothetical protein [Corallococcus interemptor]|uniref:ApeA N-terminal domain 1-containing protein n=1 Tax=Corallococcus interemptor TaxID=2316720 RepID=UPI0011C45DB6|nr:hypothetical protein [Corallococcus interemptor]
MGIAHTKTQAYLVGAKARRQAIHGTILRMTTSARYRGVFSLNSGDSASGYFEIGADGELAIEIHGTLRAEEEAILDSDAAVTIEGAIADSPFHGHALTLTNCLRTQQRFGIGGTSERWFVGRAVIGRKTITATTVFDKVVLALNGLTSFMPPPPPLASGNTIAINLPEDVEPITVSRLSLPPWEVSFIWKTTGTWGDTQIQLDRHPFIHINLSTALTLDEILNSVSPIFELMLTIAHRAHSKITHIAVNPTGSKHSYDVLSARIAPPKKQEGIERKQHLLEKQQHPLGQLFTLNDISSDRLANIQRLFSTPPGFVETYLSYERSPGRYIEDHLRTSTLTLAHLSQAFPNMAREAQRDAREAILSTSTAAHAYLPPEKLLAVPAFIRHLLTPTIQRQLEIQSPIDFEDLVGRAFRWATLRDGIPVPGIEMVHTNRKLRALIHMAALQFVGFTKEDCEARLLESINWRGL